MVFYFHHVGHISGKNFVKITFLLKKLLNSWFHEKRIVVREWEFHVFPNQKNISSNQLFSSFFLVKTLVSRNFCKKCVRLHKSQQFPHCESECVPKYRENEKFIIAQFFFVKSVYSKVNLTAVLRQNCCRKIPQYPRRV